MKIFWIVLISYLFVCLIWAIFAVYKNRTNHPTIKGSFGNNVLVFFMNFILFPIMFVIAIKNKFIFHQHVWSYYDYIPYVDKNTPHGASYRRCDTCNKKENTW